MKCTGDVRSTGSRGWTLAVLGAMGLGRLAVAALAPAALAVGVAPERADARNNFSCARAEGPTVVQTREARVYVQLRRGPADTVFGCELGRRGRRVRLGSSSAQTGIFRSVLAGRFLAFERVTTPPDSGETERSAIEVWDLRRGRRRFAYVHPQPPDDELFAQALVLTRAASVAWTTSDRRLLVSERFGPPRVLEAGGVVPESLALAVHRFSEFNQIYWTLAGGALRSAVIR